MGVRSSSADDRVSARQDAYDLLVATYVVAALADRGIHGPGAEELIENPSLRSRDLALLGLSSLDWIALGIQLETATGLQLPDHVLVESEHRCVGGWAKALLSGEEMRGDVDGAGIVEPTRRLAP
jgi:acyl carrier protein